MYLNQYDNTIRLDDIPIPCFPLSPRQQSDSYGSWSQCCARSSGAITYRKTWVPAPMLVASKWLWLQMMTYLFGGETTASLIGSCSRKKTSKNFVLMVWPVVPESCFNATLTVGIKSLKETSSWLGTHWCYHFHKVGDVTFQLMWSFFSL